MNARIAFVALVAFGILVAGTHAVRASIIAEYTLSPHDGGIAADGDAKPFHTVGICKGAAVDAYLAGRLSVGDRDGKPVLQIRPSESDDSQAAILGTSYLTFSVKANKGAGLALTTLEFEVGDGGSNGCRYVVQSSVGGFGKAGPVLRPSEVAGGRPNVKRYRVDLSDPQFQDLSGVDFRIYFYGAQPQETMEFDGIKLKGEVIKAPEPTGALIWLVLAALGIALTFWILGRGSVRWAFATAGRSEQAAFLENSSLNPPGHRAHGPWPDHVRSAILEIIDRGRLRK